MILDQARGSTFINFRLTPRAFFCVLICFCLSSFYGCAGLPGSAPTATVEDYPDPLQRALALESKVSGRPLRGGNRVQLLVDGPNTHQAQLAAIANANHHIHLETFLLYDQRVGQQYEELLIRKHREGVEVRVIYDGFGSLMGRKLLPTRLWQAGIDIREFNTLNVLKDPRIWNINRRTHRKVLVVDGRLAFVGGINITDEYVADSADEEAPGWRDTHLKVQGPAVAEIQRLFARQWENAEHVMQETLETALKPVDKLLGTGIMDDDITRDNADYYPELSSHGDDIVRMTTSGGKNFVELVLARPHQFSRRMRGKAAHKDRNIYQSFLGMVQSADQNIWINQAYFVPNSELIDALKEAVARGVDVRLLLPQNTNHRVMLHAGRYYYDEMISAGIKVFEYTGSMMHAKTAVIDGVWSTVGSGNFDFRSLVHNDEANAVVISRSFAETMQSRFLEDLQRAELINLEQWRKRGAAQRAMEQSAVLAKYWL